MKKIIPIFFLSATLTAASVEFRGGKILNAEISSKCPAGIEKIDPLLYPDLPARKLYAALTVNSQPGRSLSIFDYSIEAGGIFPCIAIKENNAPFVTDPARNFQSGTAQKYTLLFILDGSRVYPSDEELTLKTNFPPELRANQRIRFRRLGDKIFTAPGAVPASGLMPEK